MASDDITRVTGLPDIRKALSDLPEMLRRRALRNALAAGARVVRDAVKAKTPVLAAARTVPYRKSGTVRDAVRVRTSKIDRKAGDVGVFVNVKPAGKGQGGAKSASDPFYWRWLEFGWTPASKKAHGAGRAGMRARRKLRQRGTPRAIRGRGFMQAGAGKLAEALQAFVAAIGPAISKLEKK